MWVARAHGRHHNMPLEEPLLADGASGVRVASVVSCAINLASILTSEALDPPTRGREARPGERGEGAVEDSTAGAIGEGEGLPWGIICCSVAGAPACASLRLLSHHCRQLPQSEQSVPRSQRMSKCTLLGLSGPPTTWLPSSQILLREDAQESSHVVATQTACQTPATRASWPRA